MSNLVNVPSWGKWLPLTDQLHVSITAADDQIRFQSKYTTLVNRVMHHFIHGWEWPTRTWVRINSSWKIVFNSN